MRKFTPRPWTADDIAKLKELAQKYPPDQIAAQLGRGLFGVKAHQLKISLRFARPRNVANERAPV
jgi:hypothetical protein